jgi:hypothetical protein
VAEDVGAGFKQGALAGGAMAVGQVGGTIAGAAANALVPGSGGLVKTVATPAFTAAAGKGISDAVSSGTSTSPTSSSSSSPPTEEPRLTPPQAAAPKPAAQEIHIHPPPPPAHEKTMQRVQAELNEVRVRTEAGNVWLVLLTAGVIAVLAVVLWRRS